VTVKLSLVALLAMTGLLDVLRSDAQSSVAPKSKAASTRTTVDPVRAVIAAFDRVNLVGLGERHSSLEDSEFRLKLIRDPEFAQKVNDIVIEFGNPLHRDVLDRFVEGGDVPHRELSNVWQETTQRGHAWNSPIYEELIATVRSVIDALPAGKRLRVIAGDYPMDWSAIDAEIARAYPVPMCSKRCGKLLIAMPQRRG
jgi:hypothetical protein